MVRNRSRQASTRDLPADHHSWPCNITCQSSCGRFQPLFVFHLTITDVRLVAYDGKLGALSSFWCFCTSSLSEYQNGHEFRPAQEPRADLDQGAPTCLPPHMDLEGYLPM